MCRAVSNQNLQPTVSLGKLGMLDASHDIQIERLLRIHGPIKARNLAKILSEEFGRHVDVSSVNSVLYQMRARGAAVQNGDYTWTAPGDANATKLRDRKTDSAKASPRRAGVATTHKLARPVQEAYRTPSEHDRAEPAGMSSSEAGFEPATTTRTRSIEEQLLLTPVQRSIVELAAEGHLLVRGQAGAGKTTVLAARAGRILSAMNRGTVLFLTYNAALSAYVKASFRKAGVTRDVEVRTFHDWAKSAAEAVTGKKRRWIDGKARTAALIEIMPKARVEMGAHRLYDIDVGEDVMAWWQDEIAWIYGQHITHRQAYESAERTGRGVRLSVEDRRFVWAVFELYQEWLQERAAQDYDNPAGMLLGALEEAQSELPDDLRFDHVMVDEVQDFDRSWLLAAVKIPRISLCLAGDLSQKIYRRNFTWTSVGIEVRGGRSRRLEASHRSTVEIVEAARILLLGNDVTQSPDFTEPVLPERHGPPVRILRAADPRAAYQAGYALVARDFGRLRKKSAVVAVPFSRQVWPAVKQLEALKVKAVAAKGHSLGACDGGVIVTTYHQLKGLEFDHAVLMGLHDAQMPGRFLEMVPEEDRTSEADMIRRLIYMAMTRARESVTLVGGEPFCRFFDAAPPNLFHVETKLM